MEPIQTIEEVVKEVKELFSNVWFDGGADADALDKATDFLRTKLTLIQSHERQRCVGILEEIKTYSAKIV